MPTLTNNRSSSPQLSVSSNSQWTAAGRESPVSGYALSPPSASSPAFEQQQHHIQAQSPAQEHAPLHRRPSHGHGQKTIRQLDPVSIFERLGLGSSSDGGNAATQLTSHSDTLNVGPSPGREDAHLPSVEFEGIPNDTSDVATPMPGSIASSEHGDRDVDENTGPHRRTLSNSAMAQPISFNTSSSNDDVQMSISPSNPTPRNTTLLDIASVPPADIANPSIHPSHEVVIQYSNPDGTTTALEDAARNNSKIIPVNEDILLPFVDRPVEVRELLEQESRNRGLCERLKEVFAPHPHPSPSSPSSGGGHAITTPTLSFSISSSASQSTNATSSSLSDKHPKYTWQEVESVLYKPRQELSDQEWIDSLKSIIFPRSTALWERLRACLGIDVDDEQGGDKYEELSSDFNPDPAVANTFFNPPSPHQLPVTPGNSASDVFSFISPNRGNAPSLHEDMLSPRAVLRTHNSAGTGGTGPISIPGANNINPNMYSLGSVSNKHSPAAYSSPLGSTGTSPVPSPGSGPGVPAPHRQFDRTSALSNTISGIGQMVHSNSSPELAGHRSPAKSVGGGSAQSTAGSNNVGGGGDAARMHRRSSSGGSSLRRSFAMSSISEDAPVVDFGTTTPTSISGGPSTPVDIPNTSGGGDPYFAASGGAQAQHHSALHGSALSTSAASGSSSFLPTTATVGHSSVHGQALPSPSSFSHTPSGTPGTSIAASLGLQVDTPPSTGRSSSPSNIGKLARSPSWNLGPSLVSASASSASASPAPASRIVATGSSPNAFSGAGLPASPSFNSTYNKRAYDEYNPVFESDDGSSVAGSVRSTGRGPGMRRSFGQADALSPIRGPTQRTSGGFALAGFSTKKAASPKSGASGPGGK